MNNIMKVSLLLMVSCLLVPMSHGVVVFSDDFSEAPGTAINGKAPDVGSGNWSGGAATVTSNNTFITEGGHTGYFCNFASAFGAGQLLTLTYDAHIVNTNFDGYAGLSLYFDNDERVFTGDLGNYNSWGIDGSAIGNTPASPLNTAPTTTVTFTYVYDTGAWTLSTANGVNLSGTNVNTANRALNRLRVQSGFDATPTPSIEVGNIVVDISAAPVFTFINQSPANGSYSAAVSGTISVQTTDGASPVNTNSIVMKVDAGIVTPSITKIGNLTTISYVPVSPLSEGSVHSVEVTLSENGGTSHTNAWSFTTGYSSLPVTLPGPFTATESAPLTIFTEAGDPWLGANYGTSSAKTIYTRFSMVFDDVNGLTADFNAFGGLHFYRNDNATEVLLLGNNFGSPNWSLDHITDTDYELLPVTTIVTGEWHTIVVRTDYAPGGDDTSTVWLDPDFNLTEVEQPSAPVTVIGDTSFNRIRLRCGNGTASATWSNIIVAATSAGVGFMAPASPQFQGYIPGVDAASAATATPVGAEVVFGSYGISTNDITMTLDGTNVSPSFVVTSNSIAMTYQPASPFATGSVHNVEINLIDANSTPYNTSWSFTVEPYPGTLPITLLESTNGTITVTGGGDGITIWSSSDSWLGDNYGPDSANTLYTRFTMKFDDLNGETGGGGGYGGLHFFQGSSAKLLIGNNWGSTNWSFDAYPILDDINPADDNAIVLGEWHTLVSKIEFDPATDDTISIWLDPDFSKAENDPVNVNRLYVFSTDVSFDNVRLRCGNGTASAEFTNVVMSANAAGVGFPALPVVLNILPAGGANLEISWTGAGTLQETTSLNGGWVNSAVQSNPQIRPATNTAEFFRIEQ